MELDKITYWQSVNKEEKESQLQTLRLFNTEVWQRIVRKKKKMASKDRVKKQQSEVS